MTHAAEGGSLPSATKVRRAVPIALLVAGLVCLGIATLLQQWAFVHHVSTSI
ncbi:MAG: hypothetical protein ABIK86_05445 [candidate division WOR-3 bacterium]